MSDRRFAAVLGEGRGVHDARVLSVRLVTLDHTVHGLAARVADLEGDVDAMNLLLDACTCASVNSPTACACVCSGRSEMAAPTHNRWHGRGMGRARGYGVRAMTAPAGRNGRRLYGRWTHESIRTELLAFVGERRDWPRAPEFEAAGQSALRGAVKRHGGATYWARELGLQMEPMQDRRKYTEADALRDLKAVVAQYGFLPGDGRLRQDGRSRLASFVRKQPGGYEAFRLKHGLSGPPHRY